MNGLNMITIEGNLTADPAYKEIGANKTPLCTFTVANDRYYRLQDGTWGKETVFAGVEAWGRTALLVKEHGAKGKGATITGRLKSSRWTAPDGSARSRLFISAWNAEFRPVFTSVKPAGEPVAEPPPVADEEGEPEYSAERLAELAAQDPIPF